LSNDASARLGLPYLAAAQAQKHVTLNAALGRLDGLVQLSAASRSVTAEPATPADGAVYIIPAGATGTDWAGKAAGMLALFTAGAWSFIAPGLGWLAFVQDETRLVLFGSGGWVPALQVDPATGRLTLAPVNGSQEITNNSGTLPAAPADTVLRVSGQDGHQARLVFDAFGGQGNFVYRRAGGTASAPVALAAGDIIGQFSWFGYGATGYSTASRAQLRCYAAEAWTDTANGTRLAFCTTGAGTTAQYIRLLVGQSGGVRIDASGVDAVEDTANALSVRGNSALFEAASGGSFRAAVNKTASANDAALMFETAYSARALAGLLGSDDFTLKLSPDGAAYFTGLVADHASGRVSLPANPRFAATSNFDNYIAAATPTKLGFNVADLNPQNAFSAASNAFTAPAAGYYRFSVSVLFKKNAALPSGAAVQFYRNGSPAGRGMASAASPQDQVTSLNLAVALALNAGDVIDARATLTGADGYIASAGSSFCGEWVG
jgi:hypothetical protein